MMVASCVVVVVVVMMMDEKIARNAHPPRHAKTNANRNNNSNIVQRIVSWCKRMHYAHAGVECIFRSTEFCATMCF